MRYYCTEERHSISGNGVFYLGRCEELAEELIDKYAGKVQLVYLDPPFCTGNSFSFKVGKGKNAVTVPAYSDERTIDDFVEWMRKVLVCCHKLLSDSGSIYLHIDYRTTAHMRILMDEVFGEKNFMNEIIWPYKTGGRSTRYFPRKHDTILFYRKGPKHYFNISAVGVPRGAERRNHMKRFISEDGRVAYSIRSGGKLYTYYEDTLVYPSDVWSDIMHLQQKDKERTGYATQKPEALLDRIILSSSKPGDIVADLFSGSGTTAMSACKNGRSFVVADESPLSAYVLRKRFMGMTGVNNLFNENNNCLKLKYPIDKSECKVDFAIIKRRGVRYVELRSAVFQDPTDVPLYIACGCVQGETFVSANINQTPRLPAKLMLADESVNALHIVSAKGKQVFVGIED